MHRVQTRILRTLPPISARTSCRLGFHRRLVLLLAWLTLLPTDGCFLQYAQCFIGLLINSSDRFGLACQHSPRLAAVKEAATASRPASCSGQADVRALESGRVPGFEQRGAAGFSRQHRTGVASALETHQP